MIKESNGHEFIMNSVFSFQMSTIVFEGKYKYYYLRQYLAAGHRLSGPWMKLSSYTPEHQQENASQVVLGLDHLQGAFYLLFSGAVVALLTLQAETLLPR